MRFADAVVPDEWATERISGADFRGDRTETAPLAWAQRVTWKTALAGPTQHLFLNIRRRVPVSARAGVDLTRAVRAVGDLVSRHGALRTRIRGADDEPRQETADVGELPLLVVEGTGDGAAAARELSDRLGDVAFDHAAEWPLRVALVLVDGLVRQVVMIFSHSTVDAYAVDVVLQDLRLILLRGRLTTAAGLQSVDVARQQHGADRHRSERTVGQWLQEFERLAPATAPMPERPELSPRMQRGVLVSTAVEQAVGIVAGRYGVSSSAVLLAATIAVAVGDSQRSMCGLFTMSHNRFRSDHANAVANLGQIGFGVLELDGRPDFAALLLRVWQVSLSAYRHAYYDPVAMRRSFEQAGHDYLNVFRPHFYFNDVRLAGGGAGRSVADAGEPALRAAAEGSTFTWTRGLERSSWHLLAHVVDEPQAVGLTLTLDTRFHSPELVEPFLRALEDLLVRAALREVPWPWSTTVSTARS